MKKTSLTLPLIVALLILGFTQSGAIIFASANPDGSFPNLSMPIEHVNYTITTINGSLWAKIDGNYPISIQEQSNCSYNGDLPMVYPTPPGTTNIHVYLSDQELNWTNYTQDYPDALHHTAIGEWGMIFCMLTNVSDSFLLNIHYEHPLQTINGSYLFLYDLNISPYLSEENNNSTCYYTVRMETNVTNIKAYTTATDTQWNPIQYTSTQEGTTQVVSIAEHSEYNKPLPGDLVVEFSDANQVPEFPFWILPALMAGLILLIVVGKKKQFLKVEENSYLRDTF
jgi:hypothetical protein